MKKNSGKTNILIVDDTPANLQLLVGILHEEGYRVRPVTSGEHALKAARAEVPDLVLLDITMPEMNGYEVCRRLKADPKTADVPVLFISALSETDDKVRAFEAGGVDYLSKPFQVAEVLARVRTHLLIRRQQRNLEESLARERHLEELRDRLTHMVAHDMRSPLLALRLIIDLVRSSATSPEYKDLLLTANNSVASLIEMVTQMLDVSRLEAGALKPGAAPVDLAEIAREVLTNMQPLAGQIDVRLESCAGVQVSADRDLVGRVIANLVGNAFKFSPREGRVTVRVQPRDSVVRVEVTDEGRGIAAADQVRIFEKFGQVEGDRKASGSGLGLTFAKMAVEAHGGVIGVISEPGKGSTFWFTLPLILPSPVPVDNSTIPATK